MMLDELVIIDPFRYQMLMNRPKRDMKRFKHNWRTDMLAVPKGHSEEMELFKLKASDVDTYKKSKILHRTSSELKSNASLKNIINKLVDETVQQLDLFPTWVYAKQKQRFKDVYGKQFENKMNALMEKSKKTTYHEYDRARKKILSSASKSSHRRKSSSSSKKSGKKTKKTKSVSTYGLKKSKSGKPKADAIAEAIAHCSLLAEPKKPHEPPPINRGKVGDIDKELIDRLACYKHFSPKYVDNSMKTWKYEHFVSEEALNYQPSNRIYEMAIPKLPLVQEHPQVGIVEPNALRAIATPRILELATPKPRSAVAEADYNEDAFKISPSALKYKATERIIELSKPRVQS